MRWWTVIRRSWFARSEDGGHDNVVDLPLSNDRLQHLLAERQTTNLELQARLVEAQTRAARWSVRAALAVSVFLCLLALRWWLF